MSMAHTPFIVAAYALTLLGLVGLLGWCWISMRRAERAVDDMQRGAS